MSRKNYFWGYFQDDGMAGLFLLSEKNSSWEQRGMAGKHINISIPVGSVSRDKGDWKEEVKY